MAAGLPGERTRWVEPSGWAAPAMPVVTGQLLPDTNAPARPRPTAETSSCESRQGSVGLDARRDGGRHAVHPHPRRRLFACSLPHASAALPEAVLVNTAGGIAGGDRLRIDLDLDPGARLVATTASAEKVYRSLGADADIGVSDAARRRCGAVLVAPGNHHVRSRAACPTHDPELAASARLVCVEAIVFGRTAMGESITTGHFPTAGACASTGTARFAENLHLEGAVAARLGNAPWLPAGSRRQLCWWSREKRPNWRPYETLRRTSVARSEFRPGTASRLPACSHPAAPACGASWRARSQRLADRGAAPMADLTDHIRKSLPPCISLRAKRTSC